MATQGTTQGPKSGRGPNEKVTTETLEADIARLRDDIAALAKQITATGERSMHTARRAANEGVENLRARGEAAMDDLRGSARDMEAEVTAAVREKPITSLAIAAAAGFLFALIARR